MPKNSLIPVILDKRKLLFSLICTDFHLQKVLLARLRK